MDWSIKSLVLDFFESASTLSAEFLYIPRKCIRVSHFLAKLKSGSSMDMVLLYLSRLMCKLVNPL